MTEIVESIEISRRPQDVFSTRRSSPNGKRCRRRSLASGSSCCRTLRAWVGQLEDGPMTLGAWRLFVR
jgi:hypothetical protein